MLGSHTAVSVLAAASLGAGGFLMVVPTGSSEASVHPAPVVSSISPDFGSTAGGTTVTIIGTGFIGAKQVLFGFGDPAASYTVDSDTQITATSPVDPDPKIEDRNIHVTGPGGTSATVPGDRYDYEPPPPVLTSISPPSGSTAGGTTVIITGTGLQTTRKVQFGYGSLAASFTVDSDTQITAVSPAEPRGSKNIIVSTTVGVTPIVAADKFTFIQPSE
jgi:hypothetical protein